MLYAWDKNRQFDWGVSGLNQHKFEKGIYFLYYNRKV